MRGIFPLISKRPGSIAGMHRMAQGCCVQNTCCSSTAMYRSASFTPLARLLSQARSLHLLAHTCAVQPPMTPCALFVEWVSALRALLRITSARRPRVYDMSRIITLEYNSSFPRLELILLTSALSTCLQTAMSADVQELGALSTRLP